jgi:glyoxylase-like metal-dependent hydrolase (beta-lactamase superfamily II)
VEMITPYLRCILAPNAGPMTLDGTNTWLLGDPTRGPIVVVDPGPADDHHLKLIMDACAGGISDILLTHWHSDHSDAAPALAQLAGCGVRAADPAFAVPDPRTGPSAVPDGTGIAAPAAELTVIVTPGHTSDSLSFLLQGADGARWLLTGDMVLGRGTTVIMHPDGNLGAYLQSLDRMERVVHDYDVAQILPGHGPRVGRPGRAVEVVPDAPAGATSAGTGGGGRRSAYGRRGGSGCLRRRPRQRSAGRRTVGRGSARLPLGARF